VVKIEPRSAPYFVEVTNRFLLLRPIGLALRARLRLKGTGPFISMAQPPRLGKAGNVAHATDKISNQTTTRSCDFGSAEIRIIGMWTLLLPVIILPSAISAAAAPQIPSMTPQRPDVVERFLGEYARQHPLTPPPAKSVNVVKPTVKPQSGQQGNVCSVPLLPAEIDQTKNYAVQQLTPPAVDQSMVKKPAAPSCEEPRSNRKP
jgi:hypothetical protein